MDHAGSSPSRLSTANWTLESILSLGSRLTPVHRVSASLPESELLAAIENFEYKGLPLVIEGWHQNPSWNANILSPDWLANKYSEPLPVRNVYSREDQRMSIAELLSKYSAGKEYAHPEDSERWYGKDLPFPSEWDDQLKILPSQVLPLGAGDTFAYMDRKDRPETTMCYLGIGDTYTPAHKDSSASTGQNLMVYTSPMVSQESSSKGTRLGDILDSGETSSFWFLSSSADSDDASEWFQKSLHQELDLESHTITLDEFKTANFPIYVCQQKLGDMVIIPRMSCHQVVNHGGISLKVAWSRMPMSSMEAAVLFELPVYHRVGRPEIYRVKRLVHQTIEQLTPKYQQLPKLERHHFRRLLRLISEMHIEEYHPDYKDFLVETTNDLNFTCDCCSADIFQTYFECKKCTPPNEPDQFYTMCTICYVEGRSCKCEDMAPRVLRPWPELLRIRNNAASVFRIPELTLEDYNTSAHLSIFKAAVLLREQRKAGTPSRGQVSKTMRRCSPSRNSEVSHVVPLVALVRCPPCHRSICYQHTLHSSFLHVAEAILMMHKDPSYQSYHSLHIQSRTRWRDAHLPGSEINNDIKIRLARAALRHSVCRPADAERTRLGWYDNVMVVADDQRDSLSDSSLTSLTDESPNPGSLLRKLSTDRAKNGSTPSKPISGLKRVRSFDAGTPIDRGKNDSTPSKSISGLKRLRSFDARAPIDLGKNDSTPSKPMSGLKRLRPFDTGTSVDGRKAPKARKTGSQQNNVNAQLPMSTPRASSPNPPPAQAPGSTSPTRRMSSSALVAGPSSPVAKNPTTEESLRGDSHAPDRGDRDSVQMIMPPSHSLPKSLDANRPQDPSLSETILRLVADHQSQLRANTEQWAARADDRKAEDQERERRLEARLVAQREEYQARELTLREEYRARERHMEGMLTAMREENKEKERRMEDYHAAILAVYREKEQRLDREFTILREREQRLEAQLKDRWNPSAAYLAAPPRDDHLPARNHTDTDTSQKGVAGPASSPHDGLGRAVDLSRSTADSPPKLQDASDLGVSSPPPSSS